MLRLAAGRVGRRAWSRVCDAGSGARLRVARGMCSAGEEDPLTSERMRMDYDVVIVGAGPAGLSAGIRIKQLAAETGKDVSVCIVEKGAEVGAHVLSGNVFEPRALDELIPDWKEKGAPLETEAGDDVFLVMSPADSVAVPTPLLPSVLHNHGNYIISLSKLTRWLGEQAEELGVEIYPGFAASEVVYGEDGAVNGIATRDVGIGKDGTARDSFERGMELHAQQTLFAEGCRGSCSESVMRKFGLRGEGVQPQTYGLGIKEVWQIPEEKCKPGLITHTLGFPLQRGGLDKTFGGGFLYHMAPNLVLAGLVVGLDYENPYISPYEEMQQWKTHPAIREHLEGGECISYGARCLNEGGFHAIPKLTFPGGALIGCSAGFLNSIKIKGTHTAMKSGMLAAESIHTELTEGDKAESAVAMTGEIPEGAARAEVTAYEEGVRNSWVWAELKEVRNAHQGFKAGFFPGLLNAGLIAHVTKGREPWTLGNSKTDAQKTKKAKEFEKIKYPKPDGKLTFDLLANLARSGTNHNGDQPAHLRVKPDKASVPSSVSITEYAGPEQRFCPARVYEFAEEDAEGKRELVINAQNCVHCKCCSIKMPEEYIEWTVPEGGGGPAYSVM